MGALLALIILVHDAPSGMAYPPECCGREDCRPVPCEELAEGPKGAVTYHSKYLDKLFEKQRVHPSQDAQCHVCLHGNGDNPICVFIQQGV